MFGAVGRPLRNGHHYMLASSTDIPEVKRFLIEAAKDEDAFLVLCAQCGLGTASDAERGEEEERSHSKWPRLRW